MPELITALGELALASRLKRLAERLMQDVSHVYHEQGLDFEPRWFLLFFELARSGPLALTELATRIGVTHPAVNQAANELVKHGLLESRSDRHDRRRRLLQLSPSGRRLAAALQVIWQDIREATAGLLEEACPNLLGEMARAELALDRQGMYERVRERVKARQRAAVEIVPYRREYRAKFTALNRRWLADSFAIEPPDRAVLDDPEGEVIAKNGTILFARLAGKVVGTCALLPRSPRSHELLKMAVAPEFQGRQVGRKLALAAIEHARRLRARELFVRTSPRLEIANRLYQSLGFEYSGADQSGDYRRPTVVYRLELAKD